MHAIMRGSVLFYTCSKHVQSLINHVLGQGTDLPSDLLSCHTMHFFFGRDLGILTNTLSLTLPLQSMFLHPNLQVMFLGKRTLLNGKHFT